MLPLATCRSRRRIAAFLAAASLAAPAAAAAQELPVPEDFGVFLPLDAAASGFSGPSGLGAGAMARPGLVVRSRRVALDEDAFGRIVDVLDAGQSAPLVRLNLFPDVVVDSLVDHHDVTASGHSWSGGVQGDPTGSVAVAVSGEVLHAIVRTGGRVYTITRIGEGEYSVRELDRSNLPDGMPPVAPPRGDLLDPPAPTFVDDPSRVDIAVFHTAQATRDAGGTDEIGALIDAWIADTNAAYLRSDIHHRLNLVLRQQVPYVEAADTDERSAASQAIDCFEDADDGCLDVDEIREEFSADLVHLIISTGVPVDAETFSCGIAYMTGDYGVSELFCGSATFAHEVGHNSGVNHDRYVEYDDTCETDADVSCFDPAAAPYAYGYVNQGGLTSTAPFERRWRTLMSYSRQCRDEDVSCRQLMRFSNPAQSWYGDSLGVSGSRERSSYRDAADAARRGPADAARTHRDFALDLANRVVRTAPDLTLKGLRAAPTQAAPGDTVRLTTVVENLGISTGPVSDLEVRWCDASSSTCSSSARGVPAAVPALEANDRVLASTSFEAPGSSGSYSFRACVSAAPGETLTKNNCSAPVSVDVGVVDLQFSMTLSPSSVRAGGRVTIRGTVRNRGSIASSAGRVAFVTLDAGDIEIVGVRSFSTIEARSSKTLETVFEAPSVAGDHRYFVCLLSAHVELDCVSETLTVTSSSSSGTGGAAVPATRS